MRGYIIEGGTPLHGEVQVYGNKNSALPCIAACLLTASEVTISNVPLIQDVRVMCDIATQLGAEVVFDETRQTLSVCAKQIHTTHVPPELATKIRASFLFAGPLLARTGSASISLPGGDVIGRRRLDTHLMALQKLGAEYEVSHTVDFRAPRGLHGAVVFLDEASVTATENAVMAAVCAHGSTCIRNAACEPHVQDLCQLLIAMGAQIIGIGSNVLHIEGVSSLHGASFCIGPDFMEIGSFIGLAAATRSDLTIKAVGTVHLDMIRINFNKLGVDWEQVGDDIRVHVTQTPRITSDIGGAVARIDDAPWPGFPADLMSIALVTATQAQGTILIHEKLYESRLFFVDKLISMGAQIILCDPHRAVVNGPTELHGARLSSPDVRAGMALVIAALCASGTSVIQNVYQIERGYQNLVLRLQNIGAHITEKEL